jgi:hypothetical protein
MSQNSETRIRGHQPRLPLVDADPGTVAPVERDGDATTEWRLDEHTRMVGRLGIAAARAHLRSTSTAPRRSGPGRVSNPDPSGRAPGRAA